MQLNPTFWTDPYRTSYDRRAARDEQLRWGPMDLAGMSWSDVRDRSSSWGDGAHWWGT